MKDYLAIIASVAIIWCYLLSSGTFHRPDTDKNEKLTGAEMEKYID